MKEFSCLRYVVYKKDGTPLSLFRPEVYHRIMDCRYLDRYWIATDNIPNIVSRKDEERLWYLEWSEEDICLAIDLTYRGEFGVRMLWNNVELTDYNLIFRWSCEHYPKNAEFELTYNGETMFFSVDTFIARSLILMLDTRRTFTPNSIGINTDENNIVTSVGLYPLKRGGR